MKGPILWVDSDRSYLGDHLLRLEIEGFQVKQAYTLLEGMRQIRDGDYKLIILDCLMPIHEDEEAVIPLDESECGRKAGLVFYRNIKEVLDKKKTPVLVFTIREERPLRQEFIDAGLPDEHYLTKSDGAETNIFAAKVKEVLGEK